MTAEEAKKLEHFFCQNCSSEDQKLQNSHATSRHSDTKVSRFYNSNKEGTRHLLQLLKEIET